MVWAIETKVSILLYLWSKTNHYSKGKYVYDGVYDPNAVSSQVGAMATLHAGIELGFWSLTPKDSDKGNVKRYCRVNPSSGNSTKVYKDEGALYSELDIEKGYRFYTLFS